MAITDRPMFRGAASPQQAAQATVQAKQGINDVMQNLNNDIDGAQNYEQVMNAIRGDQASVPERRAELAGIVGRDDAMQTPESVLTLVQPVVEMSTVDQGIGQLAQDKMQDQVSGPMAGGIMDMPVQKFEEAGPVKQANSLQLPELKTLKEYYDESLPAIQAIYGDSDARDMARGAALFGLADRGLRLAAGESPAEAFAGIGQDLAQQAAGVSKAEQAIKAAALQQAGQDRAADRKLTSEILSKNLEAQRKLAEQEPTAYIVTQDVTIDVPQTDGTAKPTLVPMRTMLSFTPADYNKLKENYPALAQYLVAATDTQKNNLLGQRTVLFPKAVTFNGLEYKPGTPYQVNTSDIPGIEKLVGGPLIDGSNALATLLSPKPAPTNFVALEDITVNGRLIKKGDPVALSAEQANSPELRGKVAAAGTIDTQKGTEGVAQFNFRVQTAFSSGGRDFEVGDEVSLTRAEANAAPTGALLEIEKGKTVKAFVPEDNLLYDTNGTISIFPDRAAYETAIASGDFTKDNQNKRFSTPQYLYKWDGSTNTVTSAMNPGDVTQAIKDGFSPQKYTPSYQAMFKADGTGTVIDKNKSGDLETAISQGFSRTAPLDFQPKILYGTDGKPTVANTASEFTTLVEQQGFTSQVPARVVGTLYNENNNPRHYSNEAERTAAVDEGFIYDNADRPQPFTPIIKFNEAGASKTATSNDQLGAMYNEGFFLDKKPEPSDITPSKARRTLLTLQDKIANGTETAGELAEFQMAIATLQSTPRLVFDGKEYKPVGNMLPRAPLRQSAKQKPSILSLMTWVFSMCRIRNTIRSLSPSFSRASTMRNRSELRAGSSSSLVGALLSSKTWFRAMQGLQAS